MDILFFILIPSAIAMMFMFFRKSILGADHPIHVNITDRIKKRNHRFIDDYIFSINEKHAWYPQLFHWVLSFFPENVYREKTKLISLVVKFLEIIAFNLFLLFLQERMLFENIVFLYANIIVNVFPFTYAEWNAKNMGLSVRGIGLVFGQIYTYLIIAYSMTGSLTFYVALFVVVFMILLMSLITMQYVLFSIPFFVLFFKIPEIIVLPFLAIGLFYLIMPRVAKGSIIGQFNHKRAYSLFSAEIYILKLRPSIYRDFVYDFWVKLRTDFKKGIVYIYSNPIVEVIYGLPFLCFVLYSGLTTKFTGDSLTLFYVIVAAIGVFVLTSFRWTRFLGEPQRYLEFVIPLITVLYILNWGEEFHIALVTFCVLFIGLTSIALNKHNTKKVENINQSVFLDFMTQNNAYYDKNCISNDNGLIKYFTEMGINVLRPDYSVRIKDKDAYYRNFYNKNIFIMSPESLSDYYNQYKIDLLVLNTEYYDLETLFKVFKPQNITLVKKLGPYELYEL